MTDEEAIDAAHAKLTARAKTQRQRWRVQHGLDEDECVRLLNEISDEGMYVFQVNRSWDGWDVVWYDFE